MAKPVTASRNPKNVAAKSRVKLALFPSAGLIHGAHAIMDGADKYGPYNWRDEKIALMEYASAAQRHIQDWIDGEDRADDSLCHHFGHAIASLSIALDGIETGSCIDDRPKPGAAPRLLKQVSEAYSRASAVRRRSKRRKPR